MRRNWINIAILTLVCCMVFGVGAAAGDETPLASEASQSISGEAQPESEKSQPEYETASPETKVAPTSESGASALLDESCANGHVCVWPETYFKGAKGESLCTGGPHPLAGVKLSAKDRCANKAVWLRKDGIAKGCVNAGGQAELAFAFNELWIGAEGSHCP